jgi:signal transduction histidine kinase
MPPSLAIAGWAAALVALAAAILTRRASAVQTESIARACHELRGPITAARLGLELGARRGALSPERLRALDLELRRATLAVDDLSASGRRGGMRSAWEEVDLGGLLAGSVEVWRSTAELCGRSVSLNWVGARALVLGDPARLAQAVGNLLSNAIEHGGGGVEVRVLAAGPCPARDDGLDATDTRAGPRMVRIEFIDDGPGLPAAVSALACSRRRSRGPHGHGLAVARDVASAHGGHLGTAPSERGARIVLELPVISAAARAVSRA